MMVRQYHIDRVQGMEILVCEVFDRYLWTPQELEAFEACRVDNLPEVITRESFCEMLDEWCSEEIHEKESFYGLTYPIPIVDLQPSVVLRSVVANGRSVSLSVDFKQSVVSIVVEDEIHRFFDFIKSPHWRNTVARQVVDYGSLFKPDND